MRIDILKTLHYFDEKSKNNELKGHATAIVSFLGEDLNAAVFRHYGESLGAKVEIREELVKTGKLKGPRLDRWITWEDKKKNILYQTEIKSWSSWAIRGQILPINASEKEIIEVAKRDWNREFKEDYENKEKPGKVSKVLVEMNPINIGQKKFETRPLVIHWRAINPKNSDPMFSVFVKDLKFKYKTKFLAIDYFSVSLYFRKLLNQGEKFIELELPLVEKRISILEKLISKK